MTLNISGVGGHDEAKIRKAYFKLAQKYHPDKNPDGRVSFQVLLMNTTILLKILLYLVRLLFAFQDIFEAVNAAYEFLCSKSKLTEGPDPKNIVLILKAQSILFSRYKDGELKTMTIRKVKARRSGQTWSWCTLQLCRFVIIETCHKMSFGKTRNFFFFF